MTTLFDHQIISQVFGIPAFHIIQSRITFLRAMIPIVAMSANLSPWRHFIMLLTAAGSQTVVGVPYADLPFTMTETTALFQRKTDH